MAIPTIVIGTGVETGLPVIPTHAAGDWLLLAVEHQDGTVATPPGWAIFDGSSAWPAADKLSVFVLKASSSETDPAVSGPTNHTWSWVAVIADADQTDFVDALAIAVRPSTTAGQFPGLRTSVDDCLILCLASYQADSAGPVSSAEANATLANIAEVADGGTVDGGGGGLIAITGEKATAGVVNITTSTLVATGMNCLTIAIRPPQVGAAGSGYSRSRVVNQ